MRFNPDSHHRQSIRLRHFDYAQGGAYFITICCHDRLPLFGSVVNGEMALNEAGDMIKKWWYELPQKFAGTQLDEFVVMPNHFHGIIHIVGADLRVRPVHSRHMHPDCGADDKKSGAHAGAPLHSMIQWFKTMSTNEYIRGVNQKGWPAFNGKLWQRNFYERIVRSEAELKSIREYIVNNPAQWILDEMFVS